MNNRNYRLLVLFLGICSLCFSQEGIGTDVILNAKNLTESKFYIYKPYFKVKKIYSNISEVSNATPEELLSSVLSADSQEWVNFNTLGGGEEADIKTREDFENVKSYDESKTYFELQAKLDFVANGDKMTIVKFYLYNEKKERPIAGTLVMQQTPKGWKVTSKPYTNSIAMALMVFKPDVMYRIIANRPNNDLEKNLISKVATEGLNFELLLKQKFSKEEKESFTNPLNWK